MSGDATRALGEELKNDTHDERNTFVLVFDDRRAALRRRASDDYLPRAQRKLYDRHFVATCTRNINTGYHNLTLTPDGLDGRQVDSRRQLLATTTMTHTRAHDTRTDLRMIHRPNFQERLRSAATIAEPKAMLTCLLNDGNVMAEDGRT